MRSTFAEIDNALPRRLRLRSPVFLPLPQFHPSRCCPPFIITQTMDFHPLLVPLLQIFLLCVTGGVLRTFAGDISINCGSSETAAGVNGMVWIGDASPELSSPVKLRGVSKSSIVVPKKLISGEGGIPYRTARISRSRFSYEFQLNPGQKIVRLHFNWGVYKGFKGLLDLFTVEAGAFTLLRNFSASITAQALGVNSFSKEFYLSVKENQSLTITISPVSGDALLDTYAFINGIEIISLPSKVSYFSNGEENGLQVVGEKSVVNIDETTALEMIHRKNIRHDSVDGFYHVTETVVPGREGDRITNVSWEASVDVGFRYLIRIHFSGLVLKMLETRGVAFEVLVNGMIAYTNSGMFGETDGNGNMPGYKDYVLTLKGKKLEGKRDVLICLQSNEEFIDGHGPLKGFEIFRLSNLDNSLAIPNPMPGASDAYWDFQNLLLVLGHGNMIAAVVLTVLVVGNIAVYLLQQIWEVGITEEENMPSERAKGRCRRFSLAQIRLATRNFSDELFIGKGGFGKVYKGLIGEETVAIKRLKSNSQQGAREFLTEIETLSELRHVNLVSLIGYCNEQREMILVYEYMECGTLADHLHKLKRGGDNSSSLTWEQRLNICIGASRGLDYLHTGISLIHRDVKSSNILLDENLTPKISDFGLARQENRSKLQSHVSTKVMGTRGYLDPYYFTTNKLTRESDTYAFGVVLLETLCERPALDLDVPCDEQILTSWARRNISEGKTNEIVASSLRGEISEESLKAFVAVAERCLQGEPKKRPTMAQVMMQLESVLEQKDYAAPLVLNRTTNDVDNIGHDLPLDTMPREIASSNEQISTHPKEQNINVVNARPSSGRRSRTNMAFKFWSWQTFWSRVKPSKQDVFWSVSAEEGYHIGHLKRFSLQALRAATDNFSNKNILGRGSFGKVYKGRLKDGTLVAVKRLKEERTCGEELKFRMEVEMISVVNHRNLLAVQGFCMTSTERMLVYPYMANGSLGSCLRDRLPNKPPLNWLTRKHIALGSAEGLSYLHTSCEPKIIHRDIKAANILLDENFEALVGDFGLAKLMDSEDTHVTTAVRGTIGHIAPEYLSTGKTSEKTDVFGYGIMLLELVTGQRAFDLARLANNDDVMLLDWVKTCLKEKVEMLVDPALEGKYLEGEVEQVIQVALLCTQSSPMERPKMSEVARMLKGDGLAERWAEWQKAELASHLESVYFDSCTKTSHAVELSGPR